MMLGFDRRIFHDPWCLLVLSARDDLLTVQWMNVQTFVKAAFTCHAYPKYFLFHPSHRIFKRMHEALNVGKKNN
jgi:hypothetical protein